MESSSNNLAVTSNSHRYNTRFKKSHRIPVLIITKIVILSDNDSIENDDDETKNLDIHNYRQLIINNLYPSQFMDDN